VAPLEPLLGALAAAGAVAVGFALYGYGSGNWMITLRNIYQEVAAPMGKWPAIAAFALPAAIVSPVGEEFFFRGLFHFSLKSVTSNVSQRVRIRLPSRAFTCWFTASRETRPVCTCAWVRDWCGCSSLWGWPGSSQSAG
jgi:membrane protease YdiL (CAAX protease family)